jgi:hypothetical protein
MPTPVTIKAGDVAPPLIFTFAEPETDFTDTVSVVVLFKLAEASPGTDPIQKSGVVLSSSLGHLSVIHEPDGTLAAGRYRVWVRGFGSDGRPQTYPTRGALLLEVESI